ncbi:response regulator transcription factor [Albibacterium sp.]|uniref:response regulator transcription factor n=1 Tax=Albibacterium sp. TaxID=2952885 RepID=UPI002B673621|nr:response regulator transcription factor [Albibacterium sp.]HUH18727.1 response regulator transcription factor [Albibacterium sp.]
MTEKILIADDHGVVRLGLSLMIKKLRPSVIIDEVSNYRSLLDILNKKEFDLIVLDIKMPDGNFQETLEIIKIKHPNIKVLIFSAQDEQLFAVRYLKMGADGFLHKLATEEEISKALEKMFDKGSYISNEVKDTMVFNSLNKHVPSQNPIEVLSNREMEIAEKLIKGLSLKDISNDLNIHIASVSTYKTRLFKKLDVQTVPELIEIFRLYDISLS